MGQVDLDFKPTVPVFDANVALGRRHDRRVSVDSPEGTVSEMARAGIQRALVYSPHAVNFDSRDGNNLLLETIEGHDGLVPQFVGNPTFDNLDEFSAEIEERSIRSVRLAPKSHKYPFRDWIVGEWLEWMGSENLPVWLDAANVDPSELHDTMEGHPNVNVLLAEVHYSHLPWAMPLLKSLPNAYVEISRFVSVDGVARLLDAVGADRILFGSRFPESSMAPQLYSLHLNGLSNEVLGAICAGNLERLLGLK
jgi:predicted TIM-barrel fold metal-dependent hydrolase